MMKMKIKGQKTKQNKQTQHNKCSSQSLFECSKRNKLSTFSESFRIKKFTDILLSDNCKNMTKIFHF